MIYIEPVNSVYIKVHGDAGVERELSDQFKFRVPNFMHMPQYRAGFWDGYIKLYNYKNRQIYAGLYKKVVAYLEANEIEYESTVDDTSANFSEIEAKQFIELLKLPYTVRDYQLKAFIDSIRSQRLVNLMPTGSGKSLTIYMLARYYNLKTLIVVPTINLVHQLSNDFVEYGYKGSIHKIFSGETKDSPEQITVSTWQSIYKMPASYFNQFKVVIIDECHQVKADSLVKILEKMTKCPVRFGFTGTLDGSLTNEMVLNGLLGPINKVTTSAELIEAKHLSPFQIKCIVLKYREEECKSMRDLTYQEEVEWIVTNTRRNEFIKKLTLSLKGNTLVLFQFVEKHGLILHELIKSSTDRPVHLIYGGVAGEEREDIRKIVSTQSNAIIIGSNQTVSTGINIPTLSNIIFTSPTKSRIRTLQSIGRVLRTAENKETATLFDIVDDLQHKKKKNYTLSHFIHRVEIYRSEQFPFKAYNVKI